MYFDFHNFELLIFENERKFGFNFSLVVLIQSKEIYISVHFLLLLFKFFYYYCCLCTLIRLEMFFATIMVFGNSIV